jgi:hypothetical protein
MSRCPKCNRPTFAAAICLLCMVAESVPIAREHVPVPDHSRVADQPPHTPHPDAPPIRRMITVAVSSTAAITVGTAPFTWSVPSPDDDPPAT